LRKPVTQLSWVEKQKRKEKKVLIKLKEHTLSQVISEAQKTYPALNKEAACQAYIKILVNIVNYAQSPDRAEAAYHQYQLLKLILPEDYQWQKINGWAVVLS
jgi:hypothetical protein